jgi:hypothetical protein
MNSPDDTGSGRPFEEMWVLNQVRRYPGIRPREMELKINEGEEGSKGRMSKKKLFRALKRLQQSNEIEVERELGKKAVQYFMQGRRPTLAIRSIPSEFDVFVVDESKRLLSDLLDEPLLADPGLDGFPPPMNFHAISEATKEEFNMRFANLLRLVETWERARELTVMRPWGPETRDVLLRYGPGVQDPLALDAGKAEGRYPDPIEWFLFLCNVIDTVSAECSKQYKRRSRT